MEEIEEDQEVFIFDQGKDFLEEVKALINVVLKSNKKVEYKSDSILILSINDAIHGIFEVYNLKQNPVDLEPKLVYIGDKKLRISYLLNLINKEEQQSVLNEKYGY